MHVAVILSLLVSTVVTSHPLSRVSITIDSSVSSSQCQETLRHLDSLLHHTSHSLFNVTGVDISRVTVVLPPSWDTSDCTQGLNPATSAPAQDSDILITQTPSNNIKTVQFGGCGVKSRRVILPHHKLHKVQSEIGSFSTELLESLLKHEFGVFGAVSGLTESDPQIAEDSTRDENCNEDPFGDTDTEATQNILCQEQSALDVIQSRLNSEHNQESVTFNGSPSIEYLISQPPRRHLLVLDRSQQSKHAWKHLRNALYR